MPHRVATPSIYIAGTSQHSGKTLVSLGLVAALLERGVKVGYMKPVGQRWVDAHGAHVDEDSVLMKEITFADQTDLAREIRIFRLIETALRCYMGERTGREAYYGVDVEVSE